MCPNEDRSRELAQPSWPSGQGIRASRLVADPDEAAKAPPRLPSQHPECRETYCGADRAAWLCSQKHREHEAERHEYEERGGCCQDRATIEAARKCSNERGNQNPHRKDEPQHRDRTAHVSNIAPVGRLAERTGRRGAGRGVATGWARTALVALACLVVGFVGGTAGVAVAAPAAPADVAFSSIADESGYHLYRARQSEAWSWRPLATILPGGSVSEPLTGYHCVTADGRFIVAVVAPARAANSPVARDRGAAAYIVSTTTGKVRPLVAGVALKYHSPGCGTGDSVALARSLGSDQARTEVLVADASRGQVVEHQVVKGQLTSAVPIRGRVVAVRGQEVVRLTVAGPRVVRRFAGRPFRIQAARAGAFDVLATAGARGSEVWHIGPGGESSRVATGELSSLELFGGAGGRNVLVGAHESQRASGLRVASAPKRALARGASRQGAMVIADPMRPPPAKSPGGHLHHRTQGASASERGLVAPALYRARDGSRVRRATPTEAQDAPPSTLLARPWRGPQGTGQSAAPKGRQRANANTTTPKCAVPRNDLRRQAPQPSAEQVDWAIQQGVRNYLKGSVLTRPANYLNMNLVSYQPSNDFPRNPLAGYPSTPLPAQVARAVFAQESNWKQATFRALPGESGSPLIADYYGANGDLLQIDYDQADCGYGIGQVTDPMTVASPLYSANGKTKVGVDYAENVAASLQFLVDKWNQLYNAGVTLNGGDPQYLENWYFAIWAYNTGFYAQGASGVPWGLGWTNNPQNGDYPPNRSAFLRTNYGDAAHPGDWPYQERVMGWMETPLLTYQGSPSYPGIDPLDPFLDLPSRSAFCTSTNDCSPTYHDPSRPPGDISLDFCTRGDRKCWWHTPVSYITCNATNCHMSGFSVSSTATEPARPEVHAPQCSSTLSANTIIVDDQPSNLNVEGCGASNWTSAGTFAVVNGQNGSGVPLGVIDWHQLGTGFGGHIWFTKARASTDTAHVNTGTWTPPTLNGLYNVKAHVPAAGASTSFAHYRIYRGDGTYSDRTINQHLHENRWVSLGNFQLQAGAKVVLDNATPEAPGTTNVAFDAMAFSPVSGTVVSHTVDAFGVFDQAQNLDTDTGVGLPNTSPLNSMQNIYNWAEDLSGDITGLSVCSGALSSTCVGAHTGSAVSTWRARVLAAGTSTTGTDTQALWLGFANPRPPSSLGSTYLDDPDVFKVRTRTRVEFLKSGSQIDPESVTVNFESLAGDTHLPDFVLAVMNGIHDDYGVAVPDMSYTAPDLHQYTHATGTANPGASGIAPGRAYKPYSVKPVLTDGGTCVRIRSIGGGVIGFKPMILQDYLRAAVSNWRDQVEAKVTANVAPAAVGALASEIHRVFFRAPQYSQGDANSIFYSAPAIWLQQDVKACADGSVAPGDVNLADSSYMPDLYLYVDGSPKSLTGAAQTGPAQTGDFRKFAHAPTDITPSVLYGNADNPWDQCTFDSSLGPYRNRRNGSPWIIQIVGSQADTDQTPSGVRLCDEPYYPPEYHYDP